MMSKDARRRISRIVHDHKGNAVVEWLEAPADHDRPKFEIEEASQPAKAPQPAVQPRRSLSTGSLSIQTKESFDPYTRGADIDRKRAPGQRTDLRKLSAWIKMMRSLEEAKKNRDDE
jgi:hypothetical protein